MRNSSDGPKVRADVVSSPSVFMRVFRVNVCGGQCCHGWSKAQGSQRCTKRK